MISSVEFLTKVRQTSGLTSPLQSTVAYTSSGFCTFFVGGEGGKELIQVCLIGTVIGVVTLETRLQYEEGWLRNGLNNEYQNGREEEE